MIGTDFAPAETRHQETNQPETNQPETTEHTTDSSAPAAQPSQNQKVKLAPCPVCGEEYFYSKAQRGSHLWFNHKIHGESTASVRARQKKEAAEKAAKATARKLKRQARKARKLAAQIGAAKPKPKIGRPFKIKTTQPVAKKEAAPAEPSHSKNLGFHAGFLVHLIGTVVQAYCISKGISEEAVIREMDEQTSLD